MKSFNKLGLWKADTKSAYRRIPISPNQKWLACVATQTSGAIKIGRRNAMLFGAYRSVVAWNRLVQDNPEPGFETVDFVKLSLGRRLFRR